MDINYGAAREFQSTRPIRGATQTVGLPEQISGISIHAPHTGRDRASGFRSPSGTEFQSTRPIRGATSRPSHPFALPPISIHAPHTGRDRTNSDSSPMIASFQSTRPIRGATKGCRKYTKRVKISIHAPHTGRDSQLCHLQSLYCSISIHAPHTGRDFNLASPTHSGFNFNPRAPYGARLDVEDDLVAIVPISIHAPHTGRDSKNAQFMLCIFAITDSLSIKTNGKRRLSERFSDKSRNSTYKSRCEPS